MGVASRRVSWEPPRGWAKRGQERADAVNSCPERTRSETKGK